MKKTILLKSLLLLCALIVGSSYGWATDTVVTLDNIGSGLSTTANTTAATTNITATGTTDTYTLNYFQCKKISYSGSHAMFMTKSVNPYISNKTAMPGKIKSVQVFILTGAAGGTTYDCAFSTTECSSATSGIGAVNISGGNSHTFSNMTGETINVEGKFFCITLGNASNGQVLKLVITCEEGPTVHVDGVSLDKTSLSMMVGDNETLTPTISPADATNKNVTWNSDKTGVATVTNGVVSAVGEGKATITVATVDGNYKATCEVTVEPYHVNITSPVSITDWPSLSYGSAADYLVEGITFTATQCMKNNGLQFKASLGILASPLFTSSNGYSVIVTTNDKGTGTLSLQIGDETSVSITSGNSSSYSATTSSTSTSFTLTNSSSNACNIASLSIIPNTTVTLNAKGFATYSAAYDFTFSGAEAYKMALDEGEKTITGTKVTGKIKAGEGILFKGSAGASVTIAATTGATALTGNDLKGSTKSDGTTADKPTYCYVLSGDTFVKYTGATLAANKAYFAASSDLSEGRAFTIIFDDEETTGIANVEMKNGVENNKFFNLNGQQVSQPTKGLYIVNGRKLVIK